MCGGRSTNISFFHNLSILELDSWEALQNITNLTQLFSSKDTISLDLKPSERSSVKYMYSKLCPGPRLGFTKDLWVARLPLKIEIFLWQSSNDRLLDTMNLHRCNGLGNGTCTLCGALENVDHLLFQCALVLFLWSCAHQCFGVSWCPFSMQDLLGLLRNIQGQSRRLAWVLWTIHKKLAIKIIIPSHPANCIFKWLLFFQRCREEAGL